ncbi:MAG: VOC family protein [Roseiflexaceae bacterium]
MARILGPDFLALQVRDLAAAARFYTEVVGLTPAPQSPPGAVVFQTAPIPFAVRAPQVDLAATDKLGWGVALWFACDNADELCATLQARDVPIVQPLLDGPFGRMFSFLDPDGYRVTVHQNRG